MSPYVRSMLLAAALVGLSPLLAEAGGRAKGGSAGGDCPWWRPCGPGETYGGNKRIPQGGHGVDFRPACQRHDDCYDTPGARRKDCDRQFLNDMLALCDEAGNPRGSRCRAMTFYVAVRLFAGSSFGK